MKGQRELELKIICSLVEKQWILLTALAASMLANFVLALFAFN